MIQHPSLQPWWVLTSHQQELSLHAEVHFVAVAMLVGEQQRIERRNTDCSSTHKGLGMFVLPEALLVHWIVDT